MKSKEEFFLTGGGGSKLVSTIYIDSQVSNFYGLGDYNFV